ncbi:hypothetical protein [Alphaproteobacteria bacterium endosymbiont of Tiliacea citrago]|uniref:hypothetical protein n=1 Tax=Alphaproteobacteria bacterium endosymbiont of Tiliacea citrago TaxID=3077944 RepID=UPI00313CAA07
MYPNLSCLTIKGENIFNFINKLSASDIEKKCSYIFFLNENARYLGDCFFIDSLNVLISTEKILIGLKNYFERMDIRKKFKFEFDKRAVWYSFQSEISEFCFDDHRLDGKIYLNLNSNFMTCENDKELYYQNRLNNKLAEFEDFEFEKSLIINYGSVSRFISKSKGCYPGQEIVARYGFESAKKTVDVVEKIDETVLKIFFEKNGKYLVYKKLV